MHNSIKVEGIRAGIKVKGIGYWLHWNVVRFPENPIPQYLNTEYLNTSIPNTSIPQYRIPQYLNTQYLNTQYLNTQYLNTQYPKPKPSSLQTTL